MVLHVQENDAHHLAGTTPTFLAADRRTHINIGKGDGRTLITMRGMQCERVFTQLRGPRVMSCPQYRSPPSPTLESIPVTFFMRVPPPPPTAPEASFPLPPEYSSINSGDY